MPNADFAIIGGSSTFSVSFPEDIGDDNISIISKDEVYPTPFGDSPPMTLFEIAGKAPKKVITCRMHGWMGDRTRADSSRQIFSVFKEFGVKKVLAEGGVGSIKKSMKPGGIFIPNDYIDFSVRKDVSITNDYLLVMREPVCPVISKSMSSIVKSRDRYTLFETGVYAVTDGRHFESCAEVRALGILGADAIGQSFVPEVYLAREIGACYCGLYLIVNYAEGVVPEWDYHKFKGLFYSEPKNISSILLDTVKSLNADEEKCSCRQLRIETLLKK